MSEINFDALLRDIDAQCAGMSFAMVEQFRFNLDGIECDIRRIGQGKEQRFLIAASLGHLPFRIESDQRRQAIKTIIAATHALPNIRFAIDSGSKITVGGILDGAQPIYPDFIFYPLMLFLQEARPFMQLIGKYLRE